MKARCLSILFALLSLCLQARAQGLRFVQNPPQLRTTDTTVSILKASSIPNQSQALVLLPKGAATAHYGFFCRQELKWDKALPFGLRFRAGSSADCDRLEGKRRY